MIAAMRISVAIGSPIRLVRATFPSLRHRNYRLFFIGQGASLIGTWMQQMALGWLVYRMTHSELLLGTVGFSSQIMTFMLTPFAGVLADRTERRRLIVATQSLAMVQAFLLAALTLTHMVAVWQIIALSIVLGIVNAFDIPIRQSFLVEMLETREDLPNAIAVNSFLVNIAKLIGPSIAGVLIALWGEGLCFLLNGFSYMAVIVALLAMRLKPRAIAPSTARVLQILKEGIAYAMGDAPMRAVLLLLAFVSLVGISSMVLMPVFAKDILHGGPSTLGFLLTSSGLGAIMGALFLAVRKRAQGLERVIPVGVVLMGSALIGLSFSTHLIASLALLAMSGAGTMTVIAACNTSLQSMVDDDKRGRVMSFYTMAFMGMLPFGSLLAGGLASVFGTPVAVGINGTACIIAAGVFFLFAPKFPTRSMTGTPAY